METRERGERGRFSTDVSDMEGHVDNRKSDTIVDGNGWRWRWRERRERGIQYEMISKCGTVRYNV